MAMIADPLTESTVNNLLLEDDTFDFDDDFLVDNQPSTTLQETRDDKTTLSPRAALKRRADDGELGLDKEVRITKKRQPIAKLDETRLLSEPGIPKLRTLIRTKQVSKKLRLKGKGHEFSDAARLLNHFQLWLDNLYPRAKFADALQLVEKAGHSKRMHIMRKEWIDEGKPGYQPRSTNRDDEDDVPVVNEPDLFAENQDSSAQVSATGRTSTNATKTTKSLFGNGFDDEDDEDTMFIPDANKPSEFDSDRHDNDPDDDELEALLAAESEERTSNTINTFRARAAPTIMQESEGEDDDDLDALLAMQDARTKAPSSSTTTMTKPPSSTSTAQQPISQPHREGNNENENVNEHEDGIEEDDDDLDALLAEQDIQQPHPPAQVTIEPNVDVITRLSPIPHKQEDDHEQHKNGTQSPDKEGGEGEVNEDEDLDFLSD